MCIRDRCVCRVSVCLCVHVCLVCQCDMYVQLNTYTPLLSQVRLLIGIARFKEMSYLIGLLIEHDEFEALSCTKELKR